MPSTRVQQSKFLTRYLRNWIASEGLTQPEAAKRLGVSERSLEDYLSEGNHKLPRVTSLHSMAEAIGVDPRELLGLGPGQDGRADEDRVLAEIRRLTSEVAELRKRLGGD